MICCQCGDCCTRFEIQSIGKKAGERCGYLTDRNQCRIYEERPPECVAHDYPFEICPIGLKAKGKPKHKCLFCGNGVYDDGDFCSDLCRERYTQYI